MAEEPEVDEASADKPKKKSKAMLFGLIGALLLGGGAFFGVYSGMIPLPGGGGEADADAGHGAQAGADHGYDGGPIQPAAYVPVQPMVISLGPQARSKHLRMTVQIEVVPEAEQQVTSLLPRVTDVLNTFLRAVDERDFEVPRAMMRLRAQMLRRVQLVTPEGAVRDILIQEFVLN